MVSRIATVIAVVWALTAAGCGFFNNFDDNRIQVVAHSKPVRLDGEQISLNNTELRCGIENELWSEPQVSDAQTTARLGPKGRNLQFSDDVVINEPGFNQPYVQIRGDFMINMVSIVKSRDDSYQKGAKIVEAKVGVVINHDCFPNPLPLMGVRHGAYTPDASPQFRYVLYDDGWHMEGIIH